MRICVISFATPHHGIGGLQDVMADSVRGLSARHEVEVVTGQHPERIEASTELGATFHFTDELPRRGGQAGRNPSWVRSVATKALELHREQPFDVVLSESTSAQGCVQPFRRLGVPTVMRVHGNFYGHARAGAKRILQARDLSAAFAESKALAWLTREFYLNRYQLRAFWGCLVVVPSRQQIRGTELSNLVAPRLVRYVPNGVDLERFRPRESSASRRRVGLPADRTILVAAGRLERDKGFDVALRAIAAIPEASRPLLVIVGGGPEEESLRKLVLRLGIADHGLFAGTQKPADMPDWLAAGDIFVFPSRRDEAASIVLLQAMSVGLPIVASRSGSIADVITQELSGLLVKAGSVNQTRAAIERLIRDDTLRHALAITVQKTARDTFSVDAMVAGLESVLEEAITDPLSTRSR